MFKTLLPYLLVFVSFLLDTAVIPILSDFFLIPLLGLIFVAAFGYMRGGMRGMLLGAVYGLICDVCCGPVLGVMTILSAGIGFACGVLERLKINNKMKPAVTFAACFLLYELAMCIYIILYSYSFSGAMIARSLARVPIYTLAALGVFYLFKRLYYNNRTGGIPFAAAKEAQ